MSEQFELPEEMTIYSAIETRDKLLAWVSKQTAKNTAVLDVSAAKVSEIDGAGLQLLASLANMDHAWRLTHPSDAVVRACSLLGLTRWLDTMTHPS
ncbi:STAS domain-containing protein [Candidatus Symbiobacter mobilis]|uniref:Anti-sigma-factor antagonist n=1 Tax=Candidatus Symbiobacter mobilis CR TaxID=946483 RepID=U5NCC8_9BURK|nr:STAS domain-containing protein [Candidatus Symbiobacter mobilis]AGX87868.1 anti-sigma-factor antagonist [Candidatus Symbiobacter mobilis CR]